MDELKEKVNSPQFLLKRLILQLSMKFSKILLITSSFIGTTDPTNTP